MFFSGDKIYTNINKQSNLQYIRVCNKNAVELLKSTTIIHSIIIGSMNIYVVFPLTTSLFSDEIQLPIPQLLPFTDYTTTYGLILNVLNNVCVCVIGLAGNVGIEIISSMLKNTVWACTDAVCFSIKEMCDLIENHQQKHCRNIECQFRNIFIQIQDLDR